MGFLKKTLKKVKRGTKKHILRPVRNNLRLIRRGHIMITAGTNGTSVSTTN